MHAHEWIKSTIINISNGFVEAKNDTEKKSFHSKVEQYLARAEEIKKIVKSSEQGTVPTYMELRHLRYLVSDSHQRVKCIQIKEGDTGFSYASVFGPCLDNNITDVTVQDPYIKAKHQVYC